MLRNWKVWVLTLIAFTALVGCSAMDDEEQPQVEETEEVAAGQEPQVEEAESDSEDEDSESDSSWDEVKDKDSIIGKSVKDFSELTDSDPSDVRNDTTGNWRKSSVTDNVDITEYALSYQDLHMEEGEVHHIINFTMDTTTWLNEIGGLLYVDVKERVDGEEHDASTLGSGMLLKSYIIYPDGDIEELDSVG